MSASGSGTGVLLIAGALYEPDERQTLGFTFRYSSPISYDLKPSTEPNVVKASSPWVIEGGYSILLSPSVKLLGSLEFQNWTDVGSNLHNKFQYHVGLVVKCYNSDELRFGTFSQYYPQSYDSDYPKYFITGGYQKTIGNTRLGISVLDNHISIIGLPGDSYYYDQTIISLGATYTFK